MQNKSVKKLNVGYKNYQQTLAKHALIESISNKPKKIHVLKAPSGYGKTVLLTHLYYTFSSPSIWLSIQDCDAQPDIFIKNLSTAVLDILTNREVIYSEKGDCLSSTESSYALLIKRVNELDCVNVFLDNYECICGTSSDQFLGRFIYDTIPSINFFIATTKEIKFSYCELLKNNQIRVINREQLQFNYREIENIYLLNQGRRETNLLSKIESFTEGWPLAVEYFSKNVVDEASFDKLLEKETTELNVINQYFLEKIYNRLSESIQANILKLSLLDRFNFDLLELICDGDEAVKDTLVDSKNDIFIVEEDQAGWFRFQKMFLLFLEMKANVELPALAKTDVLMCAACWFMEQGYFEEAIDLAFSSKNLNQAAVWMEYAFPTIVLKFGRHELFLGWSTNLTEEIFFSHPILRVGVIWAAILSRRNIEAMRQIEFIETIKDNYSAQIRNKLNRTINLAISADKALNDNAYEAIVHINDWIKTWGNASSFENSNEYHFEVGIAYLIKGFCEKCFPDFEAAKVSLSRALKHFYVKENYYGASWAKSILSLTYAKQGLHYESLQEANSGYLHAKNDLGVASDLMYSLSALIAAISYEHNELEKARIHINEIDDRIKEQGAVDHLIAYFEIKARLLFSENANNEGLGFLKDCIAWSEKHSLSRLKLKMIDELVVWLLRLNRSQEAERYLSYYSIIIKGAEEFDMNNKQHRIAARAIIFFFIKNDRALDAISILNNLIGRSIKYNHYRRTAEWYKYIAIGQQKLGHKDAAIEALVKSLKLSVEQNYLRTYIDDIVEIAPILKDVNKSALNKEARTFVECIIKYFPAMAEEQPFYDQLTGKEIEVLRLLNNGSPNKTIANDLAISVGTLKWHLHNIYSKLGVKNRVQALLEAKEKGLI